ncbi:MAG TPA: alkaline phosphatase family protein [Thermoanaerobaculia bacterium]|nr:alkaline phosphatase family protein [Thermoanaerobaculia bacterium]
MHPTSLDRRSFLRLLAGGATAAGLAPSLACRRSAGVAGRVVVLGLDGLEPKIVRALMDTGRAPNFKRLAEIGSFLPLGTTMPALSPVAWSSFITGLTPGGHGVPDFIGRDPETYLPVFAIYSQQPITRTLRLGGYELPISGGDLVSSRHGKPFWAYLTERGIPASVFRVPTSFPLDDSATRAVSGMGTPDLTDTYGLFNYYTSDEFEDRPDLSGGYLHHVEVVDHRVRAELMGPDSFTTSGYEPRLQPHGNKATVPFEAWLDRDAPLALIEVQGTKVLLREGEFSEWVPVEFELLPVVGKVRGICRFLLKSTRPHFRLYVTPINIDPSAQVVPVTYPEELGGELARALGPFWTKGLPADTKAFDHGVLTDEEYVKQAELLLGEQLAMFEHEWARFQEQPEGLFFYYVSSTDQDAHMMWRNMDESHPLHARSDVRFSGYLHHLYERMDQLVGRVLPAIDDKTLLLVCSDHGFAQFGRQFHLNSWLRERGYLHVKDEARNKPNANVLDIDWTRTAAYGIGFNGLYLNLEGRESQGIVEPSQAPELMARLQRELEAVRDDETGGSPVAKVYRRDDLYTGPFTADMPELLVGYTPGFRSSANSVLAESSRTILDVNPWAWSGDHSMAHHLIPGSLFSSRKVARDTPSILDLPVTILEAFGIEKPADMVGSSLFRS